MIVHKGRLYSANNGGLLIYDGLEWQTLQTPLNTILRSQTPGNGDTIYVGGQGEIGYFYPNEAGQLTYNSLLEQIPESERNIAEIWDIVKVGKALYVKTEWNKILKISTEESDPTFTHENYISKLSKVGPELWYHVEGTGTYKIIDDQSIFIPQSESLKNYQVKEFLDHPQGVLIVTSENGLYLWDGNDFTPWKTNVEPLIQDLSLNCAILSAENDLILGTQESGILIVDSEGTLIQILKKGRGLQSNSVSGLCLTNEGDLWAGVSNGIDYIQLNSNMQKFYPDGNLEGSIYDIEHWNGRLWFASSNGLYHIAEKDYYNPLSDTSFELLPGTEGQTWGIDIIDDALFCAHHDGGFFLDRNEKLESIFKQNIGVWKFIKLNYGRLAMGTYNGVYLISRIDGKWQSPEFIDGLYESCRVMAYDEHENLWISHPYKQVYRIRFGHASKTTAIKEYNKTDGFKTDQRNYVYEIEGQCYLTNETGVYQYDYTTDQFIPSAPFKEPYPAGNHLRSLVHKNGGTWAISNGGTAKISLPTSDMEKLSQVSIANINTNENYIGGFENLFPYNDSTLLTCSDHGVNKFSKTNQAPKPQKPTLTTTMLGDAQDSLLYGGYGNAALSSLEAKQNAIRFDFAALESKAYPQAFYRYLLEGHDEDWSEWTDQSFKEYHRLDAGQYTFMVRSVGPDSSESESAVYKFEIERAWYKTIWAYLFYFLGFALLVFLLLRIPNKRYQENTTQLEAEKAKVSEEKDRIAREKEQAEKEVIAARQRMERLQKEKLENEIAFKNKELAMSTMNILQKNETLDAIRSEIELVTKKIKDPEAKKEIRKIVSLLRSDDRLDDDWNNFSIHFDQAHHNFLRRLKEKHPNLTPKDQKLCAYLRMNLTTKEIAPLLKISVRGVEISRYRLRKKLALAKEVNLNDFMMSF